MKIYLPLLCVIIAISYFSFTSEKTESVIVLELFTSQGCSSCPAADNLLNKIITNAEQEEKQIIGLSYHVSYWNYLGWKDPYSNEAYNSLQQKYATSLNSTVYTPQMIVNGRKEFVGSDHFRIKEAIAKSWDEDMVHTLELTNLIKHEKDFEVQYNLNKQPMDEKLIILLTKRHVENYVPRGENQGRLLKHDNVVVYRQEIMPLENGAFMIPENVVSISNTLVVYLQNSKTLAIYSAKAMKL